MDVLDRPNPHTLDIVNVSGPSSDETGRVQSLLDEPFAHGRWRYYGASGLRGNLQHLAAVVRMASYAPLFAHIDGWQWTPNLIWVDNLNIYGTPNYYVQKAFSTNRGDVVLPVQVTAGQAKSQPGFFASATRDELAGEIILKVVNTGADPVTATLEIKGVARLKSTGLAVTISGQLAAENSLDEPRKVAPVSATVSGVGPEFRYTFKPYSLTVLRLG